MFVLGIDPGVSRCGYAVLDARGRRPRAVALGVLTTPPDAPMPLRLTELHGELKALLDEYTPTVVSIERVFFQHNVRTAMSVGQASGLVMVEAVARGCDIAQYSPNEVKLAVTGDGAAGKDAVGTMVATLLGLASAPRPADAADAAALALCHIAHAPFAAAVGAKP
ncbi:MAG: crossover junction endodeoxyribonuclease RuvC [Acidimicrobiales bacterium]